VTGENGIGVMTHELTFSVSYSCRKSVAVEIAKCQNYKKIPRLVTAKCRRQVSCCQSLDAFSRAQSVTNAFGGRARIASSRSRGRVLLLKGMEMKKREKIGKGKGRAKGEGRGG